MRIALVIGRYDSQGGGAERWTDRHARRLIARGFHIDLVAREFVDPPPEASCHEVDVGRSKRSAGARLKFAELAERTVRRLPVDVVHDMGDGWWSDLFMPHHGTRLGGFERNGKLLPAPLRPLRRWARQWLPRYREFAALEARQYAPAPGKRFIALSRMVRDHMRRLYGVPDESIRIVYNGVDVERFRPPKNEGIRKCVRRELGVSSQTVFLLVAHNLRLKGIVPLLRALSRLVRRGGPAALVVAGGSAGPYRNLARRLGCGESARFVGSVSDPRPYYHAADVYVHPTYYDPCSLVALEALASGLPVITTRYNGAGELIEPGREGFVLDEPTDDVALAERMASYLDANVRREASLAARALACRHSQDRNLDDLLALYREAVGRRSAA